MATLNGTTPVNNRLTDLLIQNYFLSRTRAIQKYIDGPNRDIDKECGYPKEITAQMLRWTYDREGISTRVVSVYPEESWSMEPEIYESEDQEKTDFENAWDDFVINSNLYHYLNRADEMSGIGHYGVMLLGVDDGRPLSSPITGIDKTGAPTGAKKERQINFFRVFDESLLMILAYEKDITNPRYGQPTSYRLQLLNFISQDAAAVQLDTVYEEVHWSRILHLADNRKSSEVYGAPRQRPVWNRLMDIRKILSSSGEMFWKGGFPGYSFEVNPEFVAEGELDVKALREEFENYSNGLQRYLALTGVQAKSLAPQVANPRGHLDSQIKQVCIAIGVPSRIFMGSEEAQLASGQDIRTWNRRLFRRQKYYISPMVLRPLIDRLIAFGVLPKPKAYKIVWPDLNSPTEDDKSKIAEGRTNALMKYVAGGVQQLMAPFDFMTEVIGMSHEQATLVVEHAEDPENLRKFREMRANDPLNQSGQNAAENASGAKGKKVQVSSPNGK